MNIGRATEYRNTSPLFIGVNLLKIVGVGSGAPEKFFDVVLRSVELLCIWTLEHGDSTATVIKIFMTSALQAVGAPECRGALVHTLCPWWAPTETNKYERYYGPGRMYATVRAVAYSRLIITTN